LLNGFGEFLDSKYLGSPYAELKAMWVWRVVRPNTLGFSHELSPMLLQKLVQCSSWMMSTEPARLDATNVMDTC